MQAELSLTIKPSVLIAANLFLWHVRTLDCKHWNSPAYSLSHLQSGLAKSSKVGTMDSSACASMRSAPWPSHHTWHTVCSVISPFSLHKILSFFCLFVESIGSRGFGSVIPAHSALIFTVELVGLKPAGHHEELWIIAYTLFCILLPKYRNLMDWNHVRVSEMFDDDVDCFFSIIQNWNCVDCFLHSCVLLYILSPNVYAIVYWSVYVKAFCSQQISCLSRNNSTCSIIWVLKAAQG